MAERLRFDVRHEKHGWLWVSLAWDDFATEFPASHVPCDSVGQLAQAMLTLLTYDGPVTVVWNTEPVEWEFRFRRSGPQAELCVWEFEDGRRRTGTGTLRATLSLPLLELTAPFTNALVRLGRDEAFRAEPGRLFPEALLERMTRKQCELRAGARSG